MRLNLYQKWCFKKAELKRKVLVKFYRKEESILDIGSGNCAFSKILLDRGYSLTALDITNKSAFPDFQPVIYDGTRLPFEDNAFDLVQLITVLHHVRDPEALVVEAKRVGQRVLIQEETYKSALQKYLTWIADSINNWEFKGHPHTNKTDDEWEALFRRHNLKVQQKESRRFLFFFTQVTYLLSKD